MSHVNRIISRPGKSIFANLLVEAMRASGRVVHSPRPCGPRPAHQLHPKARERARRLGGATWEQFKDADRARRGLPMKG